MEPVTIAMLTMTALGTAADLLDTSKDDAMDEYLKKQQELALLQEERAGEYAEMFKAYTDPGSSIMQAMKQEVLKISGDKSEADIGKLKMQGIYSPSLFSLIEKDYTTEAISTFVSKTPEFFNTAMKFKDLEAGALESYDTTLGSIFKMDLASTLTEPGYGEQFSSAMTGMTSAYTMGEGMAEWGG